MKDDFSNAKRYLCVEYRSISGAEIDGEWGTWFELYRDAFVEELAAQGVSSDSDFAKLLSDMDEYNDVGSFHNGSGEQRLEMAAYGLIVFDRILRAAALKLDHFSVFCMHQELMECYGFVLKDHYLSGVIRKQKLALKAAGEMGGKRKNAGTAALRTWVKSNTSDRTPKTRKTASEIFGKLPPDLKHVSDDPVRFIWGVLREK